MSKVFRTFLCFLPLPLSVCLSGLLIRRMDAVAALAGNILGLNAPLLEQVLQVLGQLRQAEIVFAWLPVLVLGAALGGLLLCVQPKALFVLLWIVLLAALTAVGFWLTEVNGIRTGRLISCLIPLLAELL